MAETIAIEGQTYLKRDPLGVLGLSIITLGIYWFYWYYKINDEIRRFQKDESVRPGMALLAITLGWFIIVPPFISVYNTSLHIAAMEQRAQMREVVVAAERVPVLGEERRVDAEQDLLVVGQRAVEVEGDRPARHRRNLDD